MTVGPIIGRLVVSGSSTWPVVIAGGSLVVALGSLIATVVLNRRAERRSYLDQFWFRALTAPACVEPAIELRKKWYPMFSQLANRVLRPTEFIAMIQDLQNDIDQAIAQAWISSLFKTDLYAQIVKALESVVDKAAERLRTSVERGKPVTTAEATGLCEHLSASCLAILQHAVKANASSLELQS